MPKGISNIKMLDQNCPKCARSGKQSKLFQLEFDSVLVNEIMSQVLSHQDNTAGTFCLLGCDSQYEMLCEETRKLPNKRTFGGASSETQNVNGIPPYYYQKPEVGAANGGGNAAQKRVKQDGTTGSSKQATGIA